MKKVEHYICDICGTEYAEKVKCQNCEKSHKKPVSIVKTRYLPFKNDNSSYPHVVCVEMEDGKTIAYKR